MKKFLRASASFLRKYALVGVFVAASVAIPAAFAAGYLTNGLPQVLPGTSYYAGNGQFNSSGSSLFTYSGELGGYELLPSDTQLGGGAQPQSIAPTVFQLASIASAMALNPVVSTTSVTTATLLGTLTLATPAITAGATYTITMTNTNVLVTSKVQVAAYFGTNTAAAALQVVSVTPAAGSVVIVLKNIGSATTNGTILVPFQVQ